MYYELKVPQSAPISIYLSGAISRPVKSTKFICRISLTFHFPPPGPGLYILFGTLHGGVGGGGCKRLLDGSQPLTGLELPLLVLVFILAAIIILLLFTHFYTILKEKQRGMGGKVKGKR